MEGKEITHLWKMDRAPKKWYNGEYNYDNQTNNLDCDSKY